MNRLKVSRLGVALELALVGLLVGFFMIVFFLRYEEIRTDLSGLVGGASSKGDLEPVATKTDLLELVSSKGDLEPPARKVSFGPT